MAKITPDTTLKEAMKNPMAKDMLEKLMLALRLPTEALEKPAVANLKLSALTTFTLGLLDKKPYKPYVICLIWSRMQSSPMRACLSRNGGKRQLFTKFIHAPFTTVTATVSAI